MNKKQGPLTIGKYLLDRLAELGVGHIFGVPGDYVLRLDKLIEQHDIRFINTTRESCAGYSADAYARLKGLGAACITYGVGINITNALAQAYVESSPLVVISGTVGTEEFKLHPIMHHLINKSINAHGDRTQLEVFKNVTVDQGVLDDPAEAAKIIDRVLTTCLQQKRPVYFEVPRNMVDQPLPDQTYHPFVWSYPVSDAEALKEGLEETKRIFSTCKRPVIWAGHEILRFGLSQELLHFAETHQIPIVTTLLGKTVISEHHPLFVGIYQGEMSQKEVTDLMHQCDCLLSAGVIMHDLDTGIFTAKLDQEHRIYANSHSLSIGHHQYPNVQLVDFIKGLNQIKLSHPFEKRHQPKATRLADKFTPKPNSPTTTKRVFECLQSHLTPENILVSDVGDCLFGSSDLILGQNSFLACAFFASLGFGAPAAIGAQIAEPNKRVVAIIGDGGFQMTAMELGEAVRYHLDPIIIILNNHGYGTERPLLEGTYNDILDWQYTKIPEVLGGGIGIKATNEEELESALTQAFQKRGTFYLIEIELDKLDFSPPLKRLGELLGKIVKSRS
jgi:TPP-dependent 2-oxoacid decarboxylase